MSEGWSKGEIPFFRRVRGSTNLPKTRGDTGTSESGRREERVVPGTLPRNDVRRARPVVPPDPSGPFGGRPPVPHPWGPGRDPDPRHEAEDDPATLGTAQGLPEGRTGRAHVHRGFLDVEYQSSGYPVEVKVDDRRPLGKNTVKMTILKSLFMKFTNFW